MGQSSVRGEGTRNSRARQLGWDDSLYEPGAAGPGPGGEGGGRRRQGGPRGRGRRGKRRILRWVAAAVSLVIIGTAGAGYLYYRHLNGNLKKDALNLGDHQAPKTKANAAGQTPLNILLIGSDARDSKENQKLGGAKNTFGAPPLADVQMLLHVSADRSNMSVVSLPRDTVLKIPKCTAKDGKEYPATGWTLANESLGRGGPGCTVATWESLTGIHIDHFMKIDFSGVVSMADAIGGVPVCVDANVYSHTHDGHGSGLKVRKGTTPVKGQQALQWLRTRYGFWPDTDVVRTKAQHMYMNSMVRQLRKGTKLTNPGKLMDLAEAATNALTVDDAIDTGLKLYDLAGELKKVPTSRITMTTMPNVNSVRPGFEEKVDPKAGDADKLFSMVRDDIPLDGKASKRKKPAEKVSDDPAAPKAEIGITVQNGTAGDGGLPTKGRAGEITALLTGQGFTRATASQQLDPQAKTTVLFPSADLEGDAQAVAKAMGVPLHSVKKSTDVTGVTVIVGSDWRTGTTYPKSQADDGKTPESAEALQGDDESACMHVDPAYTW
ncbi:LCP family protein [Streptomyces sp. NBC_01387]|uniref:LCP family protein n=1 Tax=unclassified Streptomyces TaxID=2593676 RepID=UPI0020257516|nr:MULTISPECIES: LCP family protein [unclassified Streptomyces]MCX4550710.1 LCP family protein [Streptomyces sp. NBC_01500]WSC22148.1 LCP family protein [Streptomyces sp. NBC_01766]WSV55995.1 LCP family protein [Streptomyces sp. NBC_01014]